MMGAHESWSQNRGKLGAVQSSHHDTLAENNETYIFAKFFPQAPKVYAGVTSES